MKEVEEKDGITRYHVSFQAEPDDRVMAWLLAPEVARNKPMVTVSAGFPFPAGMRFPVSLGLTGGWVGLWNRVVAPFSSGRSRRLSRAV